MPFPRPALRAPLLWLLFPAMSGIVAADLWPASPRGLVVAAGIATVCAFAAVLASWRVSSWSGGITLASLVATGIGIGFCYQTLRLAPVTNLPVVPREATLAARVNRLFGGSPNRSSISGIAVIQSDRRDRSQFAGSRVYFSVSRRHGPAPAPSGVFLMRGVLGSVGVGDTAQGFERMLESQGVRLKLTRAVVIRTLSPPDGLEVACDRVSAACRRYLRTGMEHHQSESDLELAMFLGERTRMSEEERTAFQRSGTFHVLVVAGLHVGAVAATFRALLSLLRLPRAPALLTELLLVAGYVAVTGAGLPARRTFIMLVFLESARVLRQPGNSLAAIVLATAATLAIDPQQLFGAGFQLSYAVVTALIVMASPLARRWENAWRPWESLPDADRGWLRSAIRLSGRKICHGAAVSAVALLASAPCMIGNFGVLSLGSLLANLAVVPLAGLVVSAGFWSVVCGGAGWMGGCALFNRAAILLIKAMVGALALGSGLPLGGVAAGFRQPWMMPVATVAIIGSMLIGASLRWRRSAGGFWLPAAVFVLVLLFGVKFGGNAVMVPR